jgi:hypothetical protein
MSVRRPQARPLPIAVLPPFRACSEDFSLPVTVVLAGCQSRLSVTFTYHAHRLALEEFDALSD